MSKMFYRFTFRKIRFTILLKGNKYIMANGTVKWFNATKGFGFISQTNGNEDVFVHNSGLMENVRENDEVTFDIERGQKGLMAVNVKRK